MVLQGDETGFYNVLEVSVMAQGGDGAVNCHGEHFNWVTGM
jgi:hypothetical protein